MANRSNSRPCRKCGHLNSAHWVSYDDINTSREVYECSECNCKVDAEDMPHAGFVRRNGEWDHAGSHGKAKQKLFLGIF